MLAAATAQADKVIRNDGGGSVAVYVKEIKRIRQTGDRVFVVGRCASACTLYLGLAGQVCTARRAQWMFHGPSAADGETPLDPWVFEFTSKSMAEH